MQAQLRISTLCMLGVAVLAACEAPQERTEQTPAESAQSSPPAAPARSEQPSDWTGTYSVRGTLEGDQFTGTLAVGPLTAGASGYEETRQRVQRTYPSYEEPFYTAELSGTRGGETVRAVFTCAHGPAQSPPLVCEPSTAVAGLENVTLVVQPAGRAVLTGSHGEGVSVESGRFTWTREGSG